MKSENTSTEAISDKAFIPSNARRMLAYMLDLLIVNASGIGIHMLILWSFTKTTIATSLANLYVMMFIIIIVNAVYHILMESHSGLRGTVGKLICRLQVVDIEGQAIGKYQAVLRYLWRIPSILLIGFPYLLFARGGYGIALHDSMSCTMVTARGLNFERMRSGLSKGRKSTISDKASLILASFILVYFALKIMGKLVHH